MSDTSPHRDVADGVEASPPQPAAWVKPEATKLELETAQQTGIP